MYLKALRFAFGLCVGPLMLEGRGNPQAFLFSTYRFSCHSKGPFTTTASPTHSARFSQFVWPHCSPAPTARRDCSAVKIPVHSRLSIVWSSRSSWLSHLYLWAVDCAPSIWPQLLVSHRPPAAYLTDPLWYYWLSFSNSPLCFLLNVLVSTFLACFTPSYFYFWRALGRSVIFFAAADHVSAGVEHVFLAFSTHNNIFLCKKAARMQLNIQFYSSFRYTLFSWKFQRAETLAGILWGGISVCSPPFHVMILKNLA